MKPQPECLHLVGGASLAVDDEQRCNMDNLDVTQPDRYRGAHHGVNIAEIAIIAPIIATSNTTPPMISTASLIRARISNPQGLV